MNTAYLLILLTLNAANQPGLSFVSTETLEQCQLKGQALAGILSSSGIQVKENRCIQSGIRFSKYSHSPAGGGGDLQTYKAVFSAEGVELRLIPEGVECKTERAHSYCATSSGDTILYCVPFFLKGVIHDTNICI